MSDKKPLILLSAGGTGGHVFPACALARSLLDRGFNVALATDQRGLKMTHDFPKEVEIFMVPSGHLGGGLKGKIKGASQLLLGMQKGMALVARLKPDVVVGFGGYPSVPAVLAAQILGIPTMLHEQNAILGKANALLARKAKIIALSWPESKMDAQLKGRNVLHVTGNPVREDIRALVGKEFPPCDDTVPLRLLVMGGSLGASVFSTVLPQAFSLMTSAQRKQFVIMQQCREADRLEAAAAYAKNDMHVELKTFIYDVPAQIEAAHLFIGRSGATTVTEMAVAGRAGLYVPYPHHKDQQQKYNAQQMVDVGGGWLMAQNEFTAQAVHDFLVGLLSDRSQLAVAGGNARALAHPDSASACADLVAGLL
jgi:UDP-N-acetylglucosamine--N-acetylmuramyl-(pentapeptide) pyrophosphoryl-undecaprenol N-acetylglucosamine transferase